MARREKNPSLYIKLILEPSESPYPSTSTPTPSIKALPTAAAPPPPPPPPQESWKSSDKSVKRENTYGSIHIAKRDINSLNYDYPFASKAILREEAENTPKKELKKQYVKWVALILITIIVALGYIVLQISVGELMAIKIKTLASFISSNNTVAAVLFWWLLNLACSLVSGTLVIYLQETAEGSGLPEILAFLNGVDVPNLCSLMSFLIRYICTFLMVLSNLPGGMQEPYIPIGLILGGVLYKMGFGNCKPFRYFQWDLDRRNLAAAGLAASAATVFGTPLGGLIFSMEQLSHWHGEILFMFMATGTLSSYTSITAYYFYRGYKDGGVHPIDVFSPQVKNEKFVEFSEIPLFIIIGILGAVVGTVWNFLTLMLIRARRYIVKMKVLQLLEIAFVSSLISLSGILSFLALDNSNNCIDAKLPDAEKADLVERFNKHCSKGKYATMSLLLFQEPRYIIRALFSLESGQLSIVVLLVYFALFFVWSLLQVGLHMPTGIIIPNLIIGSVWGRLFSVLLHTDSFSFLKPNHKEATKLAYLCAVAQASGATRMSLGLTIIMVEASGSINFVIPVAIIVLVSRYLSGFINPSIIKTLAYYKGFVILGHTPIPLCVDMTVESIMARKMVCLPGTTTAENVTKVLEIYQHLEFLISDSASVSPIEGPISFKGVILRKQLMAMLAPTEKMTKLSYLDVAGAKPQKVTVPPGTIFFLEDFMNPTPFYIYKTASLTRASTLFRSLALHTLIVVDENLQAVGLITRKDLALIRKDYNLWRVKIVKNVTAFE